MVLKELADAVENSDTARISAMKETIKNHEDPWQIHLSIYPAVQRVLNPPFINPHLPKMYNICRDFVPYLSKEGVGSLVYLELVEYARRAKLEEASPKPFPRLQASFADIEKAIGMKDREKAMLLLCAFLEQQGGKELLRRLLLLGSGYLDHSLGHSISCTAFILLEVIERSGIGAAPALFLLADYFCKGGFHTTPPLKESPAAGSLAGHLSRAATGTGFTDLHHTITLYSIERTKAFFTGEEYGHMIAAWLQFMGDKQDEPRFFSSKGKTADYAQFYESFSQLDPEAVTNLTGEMIASSAGRSRLGSFLVTGVCDLYQGDYNPHYLTGLGSLLWVMNTYHKNLVLVQNALYQFLGFYFRNMRSED
jgi:hypothetical protein